MLGDPKLVKESEAILESAFTTIVEQGVQFLIIPGDLTKEGELASHVLMAQHLQKLEQKGVQVFVVPGNHDINNPYAVAYVGDTSRPVPNTSPEMFQAIYQQFGYGEAIARDAGSLSYLAEPAPGLWLLAIDSCKYQDNLELGTPVVSGRLSAETMAWIVATLQDAHAKGKQVIAFMHHNVNQHFLAEPVLFPEYLLDDWPSASAQLAGAGLEVVFTGHYHSQDAAYPVNEALQTQETLCDVETASLTQYPCAFRIVTADLTTGWLTIHTERVTQINADTGGVPFQQFADAFLRTHMAAQVIQQLVFLLSFPEAEATAFAPWVIDALVANYAGDEAPSVETQMKIGELIGSADPREQSLGMLLAGIWSELWPNDNDLVVRFGRSGNSMAGRAARQIRRRSNSEHDRNETLSRNRHPTAAWAVQAVPRCFLEKENNFYDQQSSYLPFAGVPRRNLARASRGDACFSRPLESPGRHGRGDSRGGHPDGIRRPGHRTDTEARPGLSV